ncbi:MAG: hypothetical protein IKC94_05300 [Lentisphaeria bacterium]|nr:hypothetical protein [Lentisphaeria bacterium]
MLKKIFLIHHTHYDIGFTDLPDEVEKQQLTYLDEAVELAENDQDYRWTIESGALLRNYLDRRPESQKQRLVNLLKNGQLEVAALDMQMLTETLSFAELLANVSRPAELGKQYGFPVECAILDDIGGFTGELPRIMNEAGIRYLIAGCGAFQTELPWADLPHLFYLKSRCGGRILVWNLGNDRTENSSESAYPFPVYGMGSIYLGYRAFPEIFGHPDLGVDMPMKGDSDEYKLSAAEVFEILTTRLENENYPYSEILLQYGGDNRNPAPELAQLIRRLNATGNYPEIKFCTPSEFFHFMEDKYASQIPEISGILTDPWNLRINAVPAVLKTYRKAQNLNNFLQLRNLSNNQILENLMLTGDHTLGLNTWGWQLLYEENDRSLHAGCFDRYRESWKCKARYANTALYLSCRQEKLLPCTGKFTREKAVIIRNHSPHRISGNAELYLGSYARKLISLTDENGNEIPRQLIGQNRWMIYADDLPALGSKRVFPVYSGEYNDMPQTPSGTIPPEIKTDFFKIIPAADGSLQTLSSTDGKPIFDAPFALWSETILDSDVDGKNCGLKPCIKREYHPLSYRHAEVSADGELFTSITRSGSFPGGEAQISCRIWKHLPRIDFDIRLDLPETADKRCYYAQFPFSGHNGHFRFDQNIGIAEPDMLLPGSMLDLFYCSRYAALENGDMTAILCCPDAPAVEFDGMHTAKWRKEVPLTFSNNHIYSLLYNNICNTDAPAWQQILDSFSFSLTVTAEKFSCAAANNAWFSTTALTAEESFEAPDNGIEPFPLELRVHPAGNGNIYLENSNDFPVRFQDMTIEPFELRKL